MPVIATAAWSIPKTVAARFPQEGSGLARYAAVFPGVEVNSTFYRRHRQDTFARWAGSVPDDFRFALKMPREITHAKRLAGISGLFAEFLGDIAPLGEKRGPLLCQLPPSLAFDARVAGEAFAAMRDAHAGPIVIEPRHASWTGETARELLRRFRIDRVLADPPLIWHDADFPTVSYIRLHGKPKVYYSSYDGREIDAFLEKLAPDGWCVFDNTASGAAIENALTALERLRPEPGSGAGMADRRS